MESAELIAILQEVRDRVRARHPQTAAGKAEIPLPDLMPLLHTRDAAMGKVAAIGSVNPRRGGPLNAVVQVWKKLVARVLDWHVREQVEFNRKIVACVDAALEALAENNRVLAQIGNGIAEAQELKDMKDHWIEWRAQWERNLQQSEMQFLRSVADLQGAFQHRTNLMDASYRDLVRAQHKDFEGALERFTVDIQKRLWSDMERARGEFEKLIHTELRLIRQRVPLPSGRGSAPALDSIAPVTEPRPLGSGALDAGGIPSFDYARFAERFRGSEDYVKAGQQFYLPYFQGRENVLDIGCGRGEFLEMMRAAGVPARGIDLGEESVALCKQKGLDVEKADLFDYLEGLPEGSLDGIFCAQVVEHLPPERLPEMIRLAASRLARNAVIAIETPNPECLAIFATHFYLDPTHTRPIPHPLLVFYLEEFGVGNIEVRRLSPAVESMPSLHSLPEEFRDSFFGALDYAVLGTKL